MQQMNRQPFSRLKAISFSLKFFNAFQFRCIKPPLESLKVEFLTNQLIASEPNVLTQLATWYFTEWPELYHVCMMMLLVLFIIIIIIILNNLHLHLKGYWTFLH